ncbi:MAG: hypothetical protein WC775_05765 [Patescibacteria group bacterium]|jgi:hypothetical protein
MNKTIKSITHHAKKWWVGLLAVIAIALVLRLIGLDWDEGHYLHPDERFLVMVTTALSWPKTLLSYFDPQTSPLNPYNQNYSFFVYGRFPLIFTKFVATLVNLDSYSYLRFVGRPLSALFDTSVVLAIYFAVKKFLQHSPKKHKVALYGALMYAVFVLPIQQSHFYTTDTFVTAFFAWSITALIYNLWVPAGVLFGFAMASKINVVYGLPLILVMILLQVKKIGWQKAIYNLVIFLGTAYTTLRFADPYFFQSANLLLPFVNKQVLANIKELQASASREGFYPPGIQWQTKQFWFGLQNMFFFGIGPVFFLLATLSLSKLRRRFRFTHDNFIITAVVIWVAGMFLYQSFQIVNSMRYFFLLYPFFAVGAGYTLSLITSRRIRAGIFFIGFIWTAAFVHIYTVPHSRVTASVWMHHNFPDLSTFAWENWDDPLPLQLPNSTKTFRGIALDVFWPESKLKWETIAKKLEYSDYLVLSSNRAWGSIPTSPHYPVGKRYYELLFAGKLGYKKIAEFTSYPTLDFGIFSIKFPDDWSEEAFTVYDHPKVIVFQKEPNFTARQFILKLEQ